MGIMHGNSKRSKSTCSTLLLVNGGDRCSAVNRGNGAIVVLLRNENGNSNDNISTGGKTLRAREASLPNNRFYAEFKVAHPAGRATRCPSSRTGNCKLRVAKTIEQQPQFAHGGNIS